jgi:type IX secretion system PorP/SprF family membrane protein
MYQNISNSNKFITFTLEFDNQSNYKILRMQSGIKRVLLLLNILFAGTYLVNAQETIFSGVCLNRMYVNPGFAGAYGRPILGMVFRNQLLGGSSIYNTYGVTYDQPVDLLHGGLGAMVYRDNLGNGIISKTNIDFVYAYYLELNNNTTLNAGFQVSAIQNNFNGNSLILPEMINPLNGSISPSLELYPNKNNVYPDFSVGFVMHKKYWNMGFSARHLTEPNAFGQELPSSKVYRRYAFIVDGNIPVTDASWNRHSLLLKPVLLIEKAKSYEQAQYGLLINYSSFLAGTFLRQDLSFRFSAVVACAGFETKKFALLYCYDMPLGSLRSLNYNVHEVTFLYKFEYNAKRKRGGAIKCPSI